MLTPVLTPVIYLTGVNWQQSVTAKALYFAPHLHLFRLTYFNFISLSLSFLP